MGRRGPQEPEIESPIRGTFFACCASAAAQSARHKTLFLITDPLTSDYFHRITLSGGTFGRLDFVHTAAVLRSAG
jgi:hypothetical protein